MRQYKIKHLAQLTVQRSLAIFSKDQAVKGVSKKQEGEWGKPREKGAENVKKILRVCP